MKKENFEKAKGLFEKIDNTRKLLTTIKVAIAADKNTYHFAYFTSGPALQIEIPPELTKDFLSELQSYYEGVVTGYERQIEKL